MGSGADRQVHRATRRCHREGRAPWEATGQHFLGGWAGRVREQQHQDLRRSFLGQGDGRRKGPVAKTKKRRFMERSVSFILLLKGD